MSPASNYLAETLKIVESLDAAAIERMAQVLVQTRQQGGRLFIIGVGGGAGHASHAVCDFRKLGGFEAYTPSDNVSELTARTNDEGWDTTYAGWLQGSRIRAGDCVMVFSVGGGDLERNVSANLVRAIQLAKQVGAKVIGVVGRDGGYTAKVADAVCVVPTVNPSNVTAHTESFQALVWHLLIMHPEIMKGAMKWESITR